MTLEEIKNNYTYKIIRKVLIREYPWIKDVEIEEEDAEKFKHVIFLNVYFNPYELAQERGFEVASWVDKAVINNEPYYSSVITLFFKGSTDEMRDITRELNHTIKEVEDSPAIPQELRMPNKKSFMVMTYFTAPNLTVPPKENQDTPF